MSPPVAKPYLTIRADGSHEIEVKRSRFICHLARAGDEEAAQEFIARTRKRYWDARHNCTAFVVGSEQRRERSNDDGEPGGTAGVPMLEVLRRRGVTDTVAVVTRYFGGVLLGAGGLVRAYGGAVSAALDEVGLVERRRVALLVVAADHTRAGRLENELRAAGYAVRDLHYEAAGVRIEVGVPEAELTGFHDWLAEASGGSATAVPAGHFHVEIPWSDAS
ncbi:putative YigZ family protein [Kitasatospora sp. GAS204A]|uniref:YigZ family protein n=1 Tax=unclassified Kitasatospora TaxID=2633591 RepID=UPI002474CACD|nr:YigZ family protein [Kitasatospora sp. GAS204B]MDH6123017.1 putative YigZ family protein [Kitasatospora sp. GAS204B]